MTLWNVAHQAPLYMRFLSRGQKSEIKVSQDCVPLKTPGGDSFFVSSSLSQLQVFLAPQSLPLSSHGLLLPHFCSPLSLKRTLVIGFRAHHLIQDHLITRASP